MNRATSRTRQSPMPSPILKPLNIFLRLAHPVRNNKNANQLLDSHAPTLRQPLQLQEYSTIKNLHKLHRLFTVTHLRSTTLKPCQHALAIHGSPTLPRE
jgi:hypothetical protein